MSRLMSVSLSPLANDDDGISTSATPGDASYASVINGTSATGFDVDAIRTASSISGAGALTLNGAAVSGTTVTFSEPTYVLITSAGNDSGVTFTVTGYVQNLGGVKTRIAATETITGTDTSTAVGQTGFIQITSITADGASAGNVSIGTQGKVVFETPQHVTVTSTGDDTGITFTVTGYDRQQELITEMITGVNNNTAVGTTNFATVTRVSASSTTAGAIEVGYDGLAETGWVPLNYDGDYFNVGVGAVISSGASLTYGIQHTFDDVQASDFTEAGANAFDTATSKTANFDYNYTNPPTATRLKLSAFTSGSVSMNIVSVGK